MFSTPYRAMQYSTPDVFPVLYGKYNTVFSFDLPMQNPLNVIAQAVK